MGKKRLFPARNGLTSEDRDSHILVMLPASAPITSEANTVIQNSRDYQRTETPEKALPYTELKDSHRYSSLNQIQCRLVCEMLFQING